MLKVSNLHTYYDNIHAIKGIDLEVNQGEIVTLVGSNGAGKSTTLLSISGMIPVAPGSKIEFEEKDITGMPPSKIVKLGIGISPEGREVFPSLTLEENLTLGAYTRTNKQEIKESFAYVYELFPRLAERKRQMAGTLSGGEQQMLAIARALMCKPRLLLLDEPSLGLAPNLVQQIFKLIKDINEQGVTVLLVEQNAFMALKTAQRGYIIETGKVKLSDDSQKLRNNDEVRKAYLGNR